MPVVGTKAAASAQGFGEFAQASTTANYIEDVFSTWLYTGNGSTQTITNGIDLAGKGGLVWIKRRNSGTPLESHQLYDTSRGVGWSIYSNDTAAQGYYSDSLTAFNNTGFSIGPDGSRGEINDSGNTYASWTFREQPKFFDVVTYTGNGVSGRTVAHNLGSVPGWIIIKRTDSTSDWGVMARRSGFTSNYSTGLKLNATNARTSDYDYTVGSEISSTVFPVFIDPDSGMNAYNVNGATYVAYLFAHNAGGFGLTGTDNVISCGSFTWSGGTTVNLGYEPQFILWKTANTTGNWRIFDNMRGWTGDNNSSTPANSLFPNVSDAESSQNTGLYITPTGFSIASGAGAGASVIYIAIRRGPMKTPTSGTSVYSAALGAGNATETAGFPVDLLIDAYTVTFGTNKYVFDRLRGGGVLYTNTGDADSGGSTWTFDSNTTAKDLLRGSDTTIFWNFRRAPSFFDVVCYTGNGTTQNVSHNLSVAPELMLVKRRNTSGSWVSYNAASGAGKYIVLNSSNAEISDTAPWNNTTPTASVFTVSTGGGAFTATNASGSTYVAYLFASCPGVSKVGSYTGDGTTGRVINCGFTGGARFILIKRTDLSGPWYVWDSTRGIGAALDPYLALNNTDEQIQTSDSVDPNSSGFIVNQVGATNINVSGGTYIYLAIA